MKFIRALYLQDRLFALVGAVAVLFIFGFFFPEWFDVARFCLAGLLFILLIDIIILFVNKHGIHARRNMMDKLSNGDNNDVSVWIESRYLFHVFLRVYDDIPEQFQARNIRFRLAISPGRSKVLKYILRPTKRGEYHFGALNIYAASPLGLVARRYRFAQDQLVPVYPSFLQMRKYELMAISNRLSEMGVKKIRKIGNNLEFEQIKEYVRGDDFRTINWKATARKNRLMVNQYQDEKSQQVFSLIDMGRVMQMPFNGLSLLDYAINASLVISNIALHKEDKAGLMTFSSRVHAALPASKRGNQLQKIMEVLYNQKTSYKESDFERLYINVRNKVNQRSLLLLFTNFETLSGLRRQLSYLRRLNRDHVLCVIFFENTELHALLQSPAQNTQEIYNKTIAEKFQYEKHQIVKELKQYGIYSIFTAPENLTVDTINKYLELKSRGVI